MKGGSKHEKTTFDLDDCGHRYGHRNGDPGFGHSDLDVVWQIAESTSVGFGGHLVAINDAAENDFVNQLVLADYPAERAWIGLFQQPGSTEPDQGWGWSSGDPYVFTNWAAGQPSGGTGANFGLILPDGTWNDVSSDVNFQPHIGVAERNIPEASTSALLGLGLLALILRRRREKH